MRIHLDTDLGGDGDDLCALAMLLGDPEVEVTGITVSADASGQRTAFVRHALELVARPDIPVAAGAAAFFGGIPHTPVNHDARYFPDFDFSRPIKREPAGAALDLIERDIDLGARIVAIGPYTNLAMFEVMRPGLLASVPITVMGGHVGAPGPGYPQWGANMDYNVQADRIAARVVFERLDPLIVPLRPCFDVALRRIDIPALEGGGAVARLIALQGQLQCADNGFDELTRENPALPQDLLNFHWDPVACGAALGWDCFDTAEVALKLVEEADGSLAFEERPGAPKRQIVASVDAEQFRAAWLERVLRA